MSDPEFESLMRDYDSARNSTRNFVQAAPRKRLVNNSRYVVPPCPSDSTNIDVPLPDLDFNDPNFLQLLKEYENDSDSSEDREKELQALRVQANLKPLLSQGAIYFLVIGLVGLFVIVVNWYNTKQLERLKEEFGFDEKNSSPELWWRKGVVYHIYVRSFQDSDGDGIGDINGIRQRLDHITYLGVDAVLLSCFFESPFGDFGQDVTDFKAVYSKYGSLADFDKLVQELHDRGIKVVIEVIPNHTSRQHPWFKSSQLGGSTRYEDYYVWHKGVSLANGTRLPPNNWVSRYGGSAWTFESRRQEFYYHYYHESMPDLNHRSSSVRKEFLDIFGFWLDRGIDALAIGSAHVLYESDDLDLDEPFVVDQPEFQTKGDHRSVSHIYTEDQPDLHDFLGSWREFIETYSMKSGRKIGLLIDVGNDTFMDVIKYYFTGADAPLCYALVNVDESCGGRCIHEIIDNWMSRLPEEHETLWMLSSPDYKRVRRYKKDFYQSLLNILVMLLPGGVISYYGDEIGLQDIQLNYEGGVGDSLKQRVEPDRYIDRARDFVRAPMHWSSQQHAGFTSGTSPWLPLHSLSFRDVNVEVQRNKEGGMSPLQIYQRLTRLRRERSFSSGRLQFSIVNDNVISFMRFSKDGAPYLVALNLGNSVTTDDYTLSAGVSYGKVVLYVSQLESSLSTVREGSKLNLAQLTLAPGEGVVAILMFDVL